MRLISRMEMRRIPVPKSIAVPGSGTVETPPTIVTLKSPEYVLDTEPPGVEIAA